MIALIIHARIRTHISNTNLQEGQEVLRRSREKDLNMDNLGARDSLKVRAQGSTTQKLPGCNCDCWLDHKERPGLRAPMDSQRSPR